MLLTLSVLGFVTILTELFLWSMFQKRIAGLTFSHATDRSSFRFFSTPRLRVAAILHALFVLAALTTAFLFLWQ